MRKALLMTGGAIVSVQIGSSFAKDLFSAAGPLALVWLRITAAAILLGIVARPSWRGHTRTDWLVLFAYAGTLITMNVTYYQAIARIPIGLAVTIEFLGPLAVAIAKSRGWGDVVWALLAACGVALLGWSPGSLTVVGVAWALAAAACWGGYILIVPHAGRRWRGAQPVAGAYIIGSLALLIPVLFLDRQPLAQPWVWAAGFGVGLLSSAIPSLLEMNALRRLEQRIFSILMSLEPAAGALFALIILGERLSGTDMLAMACVIAASVGITWTAGRHYRRRREPL